MTFERESHDRVLRGFALRVCRWGLRLGHGLTHFGQRDHDASVGVWAAKDPIRLGYLSPEPMLQSPAYIAAMAWQGMPVPTYAYALNNPLRSSGSAAEWAQWVVAL